MWAVWLVYLYCCVNGQQDANSEDNRAILYKLQNQNLYFHLFSYTLTLFENYFKSKQYISIQFIFYDKNILYDDPFLSENI
jgi:phosphate starvation-inducible membrane PsiE